MKQDNELLTTGQVAKELGITVQWANYLTRNGKLDARQVGGRWVVTRAALEDYKRQQEQKK